MQERSQSNLTKKQRYSNESIKFDCQIDQFKQAPPEFAEAAIFSRYHELQKIHFQQLTTVNMSDVLKKKLFGLSPYSNLVNDRSPKELVLQNHPLKGRTIITKARFEQKKLLSEPSFNHQRFSCSENTNYLKQNHIFKNSEFDNKNQHSRQLLLDEGNGGTNQKIQSTENRLLQEINI